MYKVSDFGGWMWACRVAEHRPGGGGTGWADLQGRLASAARLLLLGQEEAPGQTGGATEPGGTATWLWARAPGPEVRSYEEGHTGPWAWDRSRAWSSSQTRARREGQRSGSHAVQGRLSLPDRRPHLPHTPGSLTLLVRGHPLDTGFSGNPKPCDAPGEKRAPESWHPARGLGSAPCWAIPAGWDPTLCLALPEGEALPSL